MRLLPLHMLPQALSLLPRMRTEGVWFSPDAVSRLTHFCASRGQPRVAFNLFKVGWEKQQCREAARQCQESRCKERVAV